MTKYNNDILAEMCSKVNLLDYISNFHEIKKIAGNNYIQCPIHKGDNDPSMIINTNTNKYYCFGCNARGSILDYMTKIEKLSWNQALSKLSKLSGMENVELKQCESLSFYKEVKKAYEINNYKSVVHKIMPKSYLKQFNNILPEEWVEEGISEDVIKKYEIMIDEKSNRIIYPIYDNNFNFIGVKGRTRFKNYKDLKIQKYMNYQKIGTVDYFMGMIQNKTNIINDKKAIIFEGIKSVMKLDDYGDYHGIAAETSCLNDEQIKILISLNISDITIAFDKGIDVKKINECTKKLRKFTNVYVIVDRNNLLDDKDAPVDKGKNIWEKLFLERIKL